MARKPVERLRPSARLQAVARPVDTYVRPAEQPVGPSDLGAFISDLLIGHVKVSFLICRIVKILVGCS